MALLWRSDISHAECVRGREALAAARYRAHATAPANPDVLLIDEQIQLSQPVVFPDSHSGWWYADLVSLTARGDEILVTDEYLDVIIGPPNRPYRVLDMEEYAAALATGDVTTDRVIAGLTAFQRFLNAHLNSGYTVSDRWPDFPPAEIDELRDLEIPDPYGWAAAALGQTGRGRHGHSRR